MALVIAYLREDQEAITTILDNCGLRRVAAYLMGMAAGNLAMAAGNREAAASGYEVRLRELGSAAGQ